MVRKNTVAVVDDGKSMRRERDRARRHAKRTAEVWAMPADEVATEEKGKYNTFFEVVEGYRKAIAEFKRGGCDIGQMNALAAERRVRRSAPRGVEGGVRRTDADEDFGS